MTKKEGKVFDAVFVALKQRGINPEGLEIATLWRGPDHLVILNDETVGEYNHVSKKLSLYEDLSNFDPSEELRKKMLAKYGKLFL